MDLVKGFVIIIFIIGFSLLIVYFMTKSQLEEKCDQKIIYKYLPRTLDEEESEPIFVTDIYRTMFTQPSVWIDSIYEDDKRKTEVLNKYFISQV
jgi:hypothetical protein